MTIMLVCRLAFYGRLARTLDPSSPSQLLSLRVFKPKQREGVIERVEGDGCTAICRGMFKKDTDLSKFTGESHDESVMCGRQCKLQSAGSSWAGHWD